MFFDAYYISMLSSKKKGENVIKGIWNGFKSNINAKKDKEYSSLMYFLYKQLLRAYYSLQVRKIQKK